MLTEINVKYLDSHVLMELLTHLPASMCPGPLSHYSITNTRPRQVRPPSLYVSSSSSPEKNQSADQKLLDFMVSKNSALKTISYRHRNAFL